MSIASKSALETGTDLEEKPNRRTQTLTSNAVPIATTATPPMT